MTFIEEPALVDRIPSSLLSSSCAFRGCKHLLAPCHPSFFDVSE